MTPTQITTALDTSAVTQLLRDYNVPHVDMEAWGSFDEWSKHVRALLIWRGLPDPALTRRQLVSAADPERDLTALAFGALAEIDVHRTGLTAAQLVERLALDVNQARRAAIIRRLGPADGSGLPVARNLGNKLRNARGRVVNGLQLLLLDGQRRLVRPAPPEGTGRSSGSRSGRSASSPKPASLPEHVLASPPSADEQEPAT